ncbi:MAG TPA: RimK family protein, partial [Xanthobacteraceae bacterium]|nr:RimK family protein [Xanthobacteraceae bacterium]
MTGWVILVDQPRDLPNAETPHKVITTSEYLARPRLFGVARPKLVNLARSYAYQSKGYYASLLAEARGHRVVPTVETMLELREQKLYEHALPELEEELNRCARRADFQPDGEFKILVCFGLARDTRFEAFGRLLFDWFRCPALEVIIDAGGGWLSIDRIRPRTITRLANGEAEFFRESLHNHTKREWRDPKARSVAKYDLAVLYDPNEKTAPSSPESIKHFARIAEKMSVDVERITKRQLAELAEFDGLFIRETTSIDNHTYRFARRAWQEGMPVIDDPISMIRCTNKVFLVELFRQNQVPIPPTIIIGEDTDPSDVIDELGLPLVVKIPDGSFSRGVHKIESIAEFKRICDELFEETDLVLAQKFLPTDFDWRVGVLAGEPLFVCQYRMARGHWQVVKYRPDGSSHEGGFRAFGLDQAPADVMDIAVRAARPIGDGFYGVDLKQTNHGIVVMEVNDNPSLEHGIEDTV